MGQRLRSRGGPQRLPFFVWTDGGGPNSVQRNHFSDALGKTLPRVAVLTDSRVIRGIITAIQWLGSMDIKGFAPRAIDEAIEFIDVSHRRAELTQAVETFRAEMAQPHSRAGGDS